MLRADTHRTDPSRGPQVIGILNVTPDSFSDGGMWTDPTRAVDHGVAMINAGADWVEVGGESTRPGARRTPQSHERQRVMPVVEHLAASGVPVAVDTMRAPIAAAAIAAGATMINDVSGGRADSRMIPLVAEAGVAYVCMHWRGHSRTMQQKATYSNVTRDVIVELRRQIDLAYAAGIRADRLIVDPGVGFAKTAEHNWRLLSDFARLRQELDCAVLLGASRKKFLGQLLSGSDGHPRSPRDCDSATTALSAYACLVGAWGVRVHDPAASRDAVLVTQRLLAMGAGPQAWATFQHSGG